MYLKSIFFAVASATLVAASSAATTVWDFNPPSYLNASSGYALLDFRDLDTEENTVFTATDGASVPHVEGRSTDYMHFPLSGNTGGLYIERPYATTSLTSYTFFWDILVPAQSFASYDYMGLFNSSSSGTNDAELYIDLRSDYAGRLFADRDTDNAKVYSANGIIQPDTWHRIAWSYDENHPSEDIRIFVDGVKVAASDSAFGNSSFSLPKIIPVFQDGGTIDHAPGLVASMALVDHTMTDTAITQLGAPKAVGYTSIYDPGEPPQPPPPPPPPRGFNVVLFPDTQNETQYYPPMFQSQADWIVDNHVNSKIVYAGHLGDITNNGNVAEYTTAANIMYGLNDAPGLVWSVAAGNHDMGTAEKNANFLQYFGPQHFADKPWYGDTTCQLSSYQVFHAQGRDYLVFCLEYEANATVRAWAQGVIDAHPGMPTIINTHEYFTPGGDYEPYASVIWNGLIKDNSQIFLLVCGHHDSQGPKYNVRYNTAGLPVHELMTDYQQTDYGGGYLRLLEFDEDDSVIRASAYSPYYDLYHTVYPYDEFDIPLDFEARLGPSSILPGDANRDGIVDESDAEVLASHWLQAVGAKWSDGDFNKDGCVDALDATILAANWQKSEYSPASVPEPSLLALFCGGLLFWLVGRICG